MTGSAGSGSDPPLAGLESTDARSRSEIDRFVFGATMVFVLAVSIPLMIAPEAGERAVTAAKDFITGRFGWLYITAAIVNLLFLGWLALGRHGRVCLSRDGEGPDFSRFSWASMLFCAGIGTGILYWGTIEWAYYLQAPPYAVPPGSPDAIAWATSYPIFHWGVTGWAFYCLPAVAIAHTYFGRGIPSLRLSENCRPLIGGLADRWPGKVIDLLFMMGLLGAAGTGIGLAVPLIAAGLSQLLGVPDSFTLEVLVVIAVTGLMGLSVYFGLDRGIKRLSTLNVVLTLALLAYVLAVGPTLFILRTGTQSVGHVIVNFVRMSWLTDSGRDHVFVETWTIFYWAWWIALGPFMGMFVARISKGRSIREIILGMLGYGTVGCALFFIVLGNYALDLELTEKLQVTEILQREGAPHAIIGVVQSLPLSGLVLALFCLVSVVFMATTYDSAAYTLALGATRRLPIDEHPPRWHRLFWAVAISLLPVTLMFLGGLVPFQTASVVVSLPLIAIGVMLAWSLAHALRESQTP